MSITPVNTSITPFENIKRVSPSINRHEGVIIPKVEGLIEQFFKDSKIVYKQSTETKSHKQQWKELIATAWKEATAWEEEEQNNNRWHVKNPLTGVCTGIAIEYILKRHKNREHRDMRPFENTKFFQKLLIPVMHEVSLKKRTSMKKLKGPYFDAIYKAFSKRVYQLTGLKIRRHHHFQHVDLHQLAHKPFKELKEPHHLLFLESPNKHIVENHTIYLDVHSRLIADGAYGAVIKVPEETSFRKFLRYYLKETYADEGYTKASIISVYPRRRPKLHTPNAWDRKWLEVELAAIQAFEWIRKLFRD